MSIKTPKTLRFIPLIQMVCFFMWFITGMRKGLNFKHIVKWLMLMFVLVLCTVILSKLIELIPISLVSTI